MEITITKKITIDQLWEAVWGCDGAGMIYWSDKVRKFNGHDIDLWIKNDSGDYLPNAQNFKVHDHIKNKWHKLTLEDLANGYEKALNEEQTHCGGYSLDVNDPDACFGDMVIQYAIFGELTYG